METKEFDQNKGRMVPQKRMGGGGGGWGGGGCQRPFGIYPKIHPFLLQRMWGSCLEAFMLLGAFGLLNIYRLKYFCRQFHKGHTKSEFRSVIWMFENARKFVELVVS